MTRLPALLLPLLMLAQSALAAPAPGPLPPAWQAVQLPNSASFEVSSQHTGQRYRILLGLPASPPPPAGYPVLWALDGVASFPLMESFRPRPAKHRDEAVAAWRERAGTVEDGLIVAVGYASGEPFDVDARALDYTPVPQGPTGDKLSPAHGGAAAFLAFLTEELRPRLARHFAMDAQRHTLFGFSYGGLFTLHTLSTQPQHFQRYWAASPSLWFGEHQTVRALPQRLEKLDFASAPIRVNITVGRDEQYPERYASAQIREKLMARTMVDNAERFSALLQARPGVAASFSSLPAHDHHDMLMHGARRVIGFAFAP
jgi:uncharacterized protein